MESHGAYVTEWVSRGHFAWQCVLRTAFPCSGGYHPERSGMPLHDVVGINCKGASNENQGAGLKFMA